jgi:glucose-1-phosphatase
LILIINRTAEAFRKLGASDFNAVYNQSKQDHFFDDYDVGKINSETFRNTLKKKLDLIAKDEKFDNAWNAMLLDLPLKRLEFIKELRKKYKVFLFSNTNAKETLLIDDSLQHVAGAKKVGLHAVHLITGKSIFNTIDFIQNIDSKIY